MSGMSARPPRFSRERLEDILKMKKISLFMALALCVSTLFTACGTVSPQSQSNASTSSKSVISFVDNDGKQISINTPCKKIISLYSAHTENLYALGVGDKIIGVNVSSACAFPAAAAFLKPYDYSGDPEKVIAAAPDLVLTLPLITKKSPDFFKALEKAGILVVSLYPDSFGKFDEYITKLAMLTGTEEKAKMKLSELHANIDEIAAKTATVSAKQKVFFESTQTNLRTVTPDSMPAIAIEKAGGQNVVPDGAPMSAGSTISAFGQEKLLALADTIDVYVAQNGAMNAGVSKQSIIERPGFNTIKAVRDGRVFVLSEKMIASATFRYYMGIKELARYMYPEVMDTLSGYTQAKDATKRDFANIVVRSRHLPFYMPFSSKYYQEEQKGHTYGLFVDVPWDDKDYDCIEAAVEAGFLNWEKRDGKEYFNPDASVTREDLANAIFNIGKFAGQDKHITIADLSQCKDQNTVQLLVDNGFFTLSGGLFEPARKVTTADIVSALALVK